MPRTVMSILFISLLVSTGFQPTPKINSRCIYGGESRGLEKCAEQQRVYGSSAFNPTLSDNNSAINRIIEQVGLQKNFVLVPCDGIDNAVAADEGGIRYIYYDPQFMGDLNRGANSDWASWGALAHEIGHHLNGDPLREVSSQQRREDELAADEFAGFILGKLNSGIEQAQSFINALRNVNSPSYPTKDERITAITRGYNRAKPLDPLSGEWQGTSFFPGLTVNMILDIKLNHGEVTGTITTNAGVTVITEGSWSGNYLTLIGRTWDHRKVTFSATLENGKLFGKFDASPRGKGTWEASKVR